MAVVQLSCVILGALLMVAAAAAWRGQKIEGGGLRVRRGEPLFVPLILFLLLVGGGAVGAALWLATQKPPPPPTAYGVSYRVLLPAGWQRLEQVELELPPGGSAFGDDTSELLVVETESAVAAGGGTLGELLRRREEAPVAPEAAVRELDRALELRFSYPSPRGPVLARALGYGAEGLVGWVTATCSHRGDPASCEAALTSLELTVADRLLLSTRLAP